MTHEEILVALKEKYGYCPYCGSSCLAGDDYEPEPNEDGSIEFVPHMSCEDCHNYWDEVYTLTAVKNTLEDDEAEE